MNKDRLLNGIVVTAGGILLSLMLTAAGMELLVLMVPIMITMITFRARFATWLSLAGIILFEPAMLLPNSPFGSFAQTAVYIGLIMWAGGIAWSFKRQSIPIPAEQ